MQKKEIRSIKPRGGKAMSDMESLGLVIASAVAAVGFTKLFMYLEWRKFLYGRSWWKRSRKR